jgi:hypothetical protein
MTTTTSSNIPSTSSSSSSNNNNNSTTTTTTTTNQSSLFFHPPIIANFTRFISFQIHIPGNNKRELSSRLVPIHRDAFKFDELLQTVVLAGDCTHLLDGNDSCRIRLKIQRPNQQHYDLVSFDAFSKLDETWPTAELFPEGCHAIAEILSKDKEENIANSLLVQLTRINTNNNNKKRSVQDSRASDSLATNGNGSDEQDSKKRRTKSPQVVAHTLLQRLARPTNEWKRYFQGDSKALKTHLEDVAEKAASALNKDQRREFNSIIQSIGEPSTFITFQEDVRDFLNRAFPQVKAIKEIEPWDAPMKEFPGKKKVPPTTPGTTSSNQPSTTPSSKFTTSATPAAAATTSSTHDKKKKKKHHQADSSSSSSSSSDDDDDDDDDDKTASPVKKPVEKLSSKKTTQSEASKKLSSSSNNNATTTTSTNKKMKHDEQQKKKRVPTESDVESSSTSSSSDDD